MFWSSVSAIQELAVIVSDEQQTDNNKKNGEI
jgi:hypothetical protein